jgi:hypothetical protein
MVAVAAALATAAMVIVVAPAILTIATAACGAVRAAGRQLLALDHQVIDQLGRPRFVRIGGRLQPRPPRERVRPVRAVDHRGALEHEARVGAEAAAGGRCWIGGAGALPRAAALLAFAGLRAEAGEGEANPDALLDLLAQLADREPTVRRPGHCRRRWRR